ncbi:hypothetical protein ACIP2X_08260 [Streptomyces sp. NPDC089424]|uniref:hypothetical protein n=1 Tax=Streptomyces sp. NPDC089424 TaxID=3365917 RepID=UPI003814E3B3
MRELKGVDVGTPHAHFLVAEHWSLLATRSMTWQEIFSRTATYLTVLSAAVVALSLVANATGFGSGFTTFALLVLPVVLLVGFGTYFRLIEADIEDTWLIIGMNRLRHAYVELAPELEPYLIAGYHDDPPGIWTTYSFRRRLGVTHWLSGSPLVVGVINSFVTGVLAAVVCEAVDAGGTVQALVASATAVVTAAVLGFLGLRKVHEVSRTYQPRFPSDETRQPTR